MVRPPRLTLQLVTMTYLSNGQLEKVERARLYVEYLHKERAKLASIEVDRLFMEVLNLLSMKELTKESLLNAELKDL